MIKNNNVIPLEYIRLRRKLERWPLTIARPVRRILTMTPLKNDRFLRALLRQPIDNIHLNF